MLRTVPKIERQPRTASDTASHYGYCAFKDISLAGSVGLEYRVQPPDSPYYREVPCRQLIPFTNIEVRDEIDEEKSKAAAKTGMGAVLKVKQKTANECVTDLVVAYEDWGFMALNPLTGFTADDAFEVFQTIQPFTYKLAHIENELNEGAQERIAQTEPYDVTYGDIIETLQPLREELKGVAEQVREIMARSAAVAVDLASATVEKTRVSMTKAFSGGDGKVRPDPNDKYLYKEMNEKLPTLLDSEGKDTSVGELVKALRTNNESSDALKAREIELREKEIALKERELDVREKEATAQRMAAVRKAKE